MRTAAVASRAGQTASAGEAAKVGCEMTALAPGLTNQQAGSATPDCVAAVRRLAKLELPKLRDQASGNCRRGREVSARIPLPLDELGPLTQVVKLGVAARAELKHSILDLRQNAALP